MRAVSGLQKYRRDVPAGGANSQLASAVSDEFARAYLMIQNRGLNSVRISFGNECDGVTDFLLQAGAAETWKDPCINDSINVASTLGSVVVVWEGRQRGDGGW